MLDLNALKISAANNFQDCPRYIKSDTFGVRPQSNLANSTASHTKTENHDIRSFISQKQYVKALSKEPPWEIEIVNCLNCMTFYNLSCCQTEIMIFERFQRNYSDIE